MKLIKNNKEYLATLSRLEDIFDARKGTSESEEL